LAHDPWDRDFAGMGSEQNPQRSGDEEGDEDKKALYIERMCDVSGVEGRDVIFDCRNFRTVL